MIKPIRLVKSKFIPNLNTIIIAMKLKKLCDYRIIIEEERKIASSNNRESFTTGSDMSQHLKTHLSLFRLAHG